MRWALARSLEHLQRENEITAHVTQGSTAPPRYFEVEQFITEARSALSNEKGGSE